MMQMAHIRISVNQLMTTNHHGIPSSVWYFINFFLNYIIVLSCHAPL